MPKPPPPRVEQTAKTAAEKKDRLDGKKETAKEEGEKRMSRFKMERMKQRLEKEVGGNE